MTFGFSGYPSPNKETIWWEQLENQLAYVKALGNTLSQWKLTYWEMHRVGDVVCWSIEELAEIFGVKAE